MLRNRLRRGAVVPRSLKRLPVAIATLVVVAAVLLLAVPAARAAAASARGPVAAPLPPAKAGAGAPVPVFSPASVDFGPVAVGTTGGLRTVTLTNTGDAALRVRDLAVNSSDFALAASDCPASLDPGAGCSIELAFTPQKAGSLAGRLSLRDNAKGHATVTLSGIGVAAPTTAKTKLPPPTITSPLDGAVIVSGAAADATTAVVVSGTAGGGAVVVLQDGATVIGTTTAASGGTFTFAVDLGYGAHLLSAQQTSRKKISPWSAAVALTVAPAAPVLTAATAASGSPEVTVSGTGVAGATVDVDVDGGAQTLTGTADAGGAFSLTTALPNGAHTFTAVASVGTATSDPSNTISATVSFTAPTLTGPASVVEGVTTYGGSGLAGAMVIVFDGETTMGTATVGAGGSWSVGLFLAPGTYALSAGQLFDGVASDVSAPLGVTVAPQSPTLVAPSRSGTLVAVSGLADPAATVAVFDGGLAVAGFSADAMTGVFGGSFLADYGIHALTATQTVNGVTSAPSTAASVTVAPPAPTLVAPASSAAPSIAVSGMGRADATVTIFDGATPVATVMADAAGSYAATIDVGYGLSALTATQTVNGATSDPSAAVSVAVVPPAPTLDAPSPVAGDVQASGTGLPGATIDVLVNGLPATSTTVDAAGDYATSFALDYGNYALTTTQTIDGLTSDPSAQVSLLVVPPAPSLDAPATSTSTQVHVTGQALPGALVFIRDVGPIVGDTTADATGAYALDVPLDYGVHALFAQQHVGAENSLPSPTVTVTVRPAAPTLSAPATSIVPIVHVVGTGVSGASVTIFDDAGAVGSATVDGTGQWAVDVTFRDGTYALTAVQSINGEDSDASAPPVLVSVSLTVYVSTTGNDGGAATMSDPMRTLSAAIARALAIGAPRIHIAGGTYDGGTIALASHLAIQGGFDPVNWAAGAAETTLSAVGTVLTASSVTGTSLIDLTLATTAPGADGSAYGMRVVNSVLSATRVHIHVADGAAGVAGTAGYDGQIGFSGSPGGVGNADDADVYGPGGRGGPSPAGNLGGTGGDGGHEGTSSPAAFQGAPGLDGGGPGGGAGGAGGGSGERGVDGTYTCDGSRCYGYTGGNGGPGAAGDPGVAGVGGTVTLTRTTVSGLPVITGVSGSAGGWGTAGSGGGGGGGGGGESGLYTIPGSGSGGGGGGGGGLPGRGGAGGTYGGGSFGIVATNSTLMLSAVDIEAGHGGAGGAGGRGGAIGAGGAGGAGGVADNPAEVGAGGNGGRGGDGGAGGGGGGGAGGPSIAVVVDTYSNANLGRFGGTWTAAGGGAGGAGGTSAGNAGAAGATGATAELSTM